MHGNTAEAGMSDFDVGDSQRRAAFVFIVMQLFQLLLHVHAEQDAEKDDQRDRPRQAERIGDGIGEVDGVEHRLWALAVRRRKLVDSLLGGGERGRGGETAGEKTGGDVTGQSKENADAGGHQCAEDKRHCGQEIEAKALGSKRCEKAGTHLHADGVDKQHKGEIAEVLEHLRINRETGLAEQQRRKEDGGDTEANPFDADVPQGNADRDRQRQRGEPAGHGSGWEKMLDDGCGHGSTEKRMRLLLERNAAMG